MSGKGESITSLSGEQADLGAMRREILLAGIADTQGSIHANDSKCSAALITHGLLFAGVVGLSGAVADLYEEAPEGLRVLAVIFAGLALIAFAVSVVCLLRAVRPFHPKELTDRIHDEHAPAGIFFATPKRDPGEEVAAQLGRVNDLSEAGAALDLTAESIKLAAIRRHEATWAARGFTWLIVEVALVAILVSLIAWIALISV